MGLAATRKKQKIQADPRNLTWADNASRFGHAYLSKLGWDASSGLGSNQDGRTSHITVAQKLNMLGIGANSPDGVDAIAWKQNKEYESVLARLNNAQNESSTATPEPGTTTAVQNVKDGDTAAESLDESDGQRKARKDEKRKQKEEKRLRKEEKRLKKDKRSLEGKDAEDTPPAAGPSKDKLRASKPATGFHLAHRARHRAAKGMVGLDATALAEVLGQSLSTSQSIASGSTTPQPPQPSLTPIDDSGLIKTSTINMSDYFKQKIIAKTSTPTTPKEEANDDEDDYDEMPRMGLGASRASALAGFTPITFVSQTPTIVKEELVDEPKPLTTVGGQEPIGEERNESDAKEKKKKRKKDADGLEEPKKTKKKKRTE